MSTDQPSAENQAPQYQFPPEQNKQTQYQFPPGQDQQPQYQFPRGHDQQPQYRYPPGPMQYPPGYPVAYYGPPPKKGPSTGLIVGIVVIVVVVAVVLPLVAVMLMVYMQTTPSGPGVVETTLGIRAERNGSDWVLYITSGTKAISGISLIIMDPNTGMSTVDKLLTSLKPSYNDPDAQFNDNNANNRLDAGDTITIKYSGGHAQPDYKVEITSDDNIIGVRYLPS